MLWAAAHFAQGYTEKQQAMMDFFGTVNGLRTAITNQMILRQRAL